MTPAVSILGGGAFGRSVARVVQAAGAEVRVWARRPEAREELGRALPDAVIVDNVADAARDATLVVIATPASSVRAVASELGEVARGDMYALHAVRGVCPSRGFVLPHRVIREETCLRKIGVLGGPLHAQDLLGTRPLAAVLASRFDETYEVIQRLTQRTSVKVHKSRDVVGVEIAGAMSNVSALAAGIADGLELGETARGVLLTRGLSEAARLGVALGANAQTFSGLAGVGDLIPRRVVSTERHYRAGVMLGKGAGSEEILVEVGGEVEGALTAERALLVAEHEGVDLVLAGAVHSVWTGDAEARATFEGVLERHLDLGQGLGA